MTRVPLAAALAPRRRRHHGPGWDTAPAHRRRGCQAPRHAPTLDTAAQGVQAMKRVLLAGAAAMALSGIQGEARAQVAVACVTCPTEVQ